MNTEECKPIFPLKSMLPYLILLSIIAFGFILRLYHLQYYLFVFQDSIWYTHTSILFLNGEWLSPKTTYKGPFFTSLLSLFFGIFGPTFSVSRSLSLLFGSLIPVPVYFLSSKFFGKRAGLLAAFIVSINPLLIIYSCLLFREALFTFTFINCLLFALEGFKGNTIHSIVGGIFFAFSLMTIEAGLFAGIGFLFYYLIQKIRRKGKNPACKNLEIFSCSAFLTMVPFLLRNYLAYGDPFKQFSRFLSSSIMWAYFGLMALSVPYVLLFRVLFTHARQPSADRHIKIIKFFLIGSVTLIAITFIGNAVAVYVLGVKANTQNSSLLSLNRLPVEWTIGFIKLMESLATPESLGFLLIVSILVIIYAVRSFDYAIMGLFFIFLFSSAAFAVSLPFHYYYFGRLTFDELIAHHPTWPFDNAIRYCTPFIPLFAIFASHGILSFARKLGNSIRGKKRSILKSSLVFIIIPLIALQFFYADANVRSKANCGHDALIERYSSISWLSDHGLPTVYSFNPLFREIYGENKVVLLSDESLHDIAKRASHEKIEYIVVDMSGTYSDAQLALFLRGYTEDESWMRFGYFSLITTNKKWPYDQLYKISWVEPGKTALVVQHSNLGIEWISFLSERYLVEIVDDGENLMPHLSVDYNLIVLSDIMRPLEDDEISVLRERVAEGAILIVSGLSPDYLRLEENSQFVGAKAFIEAPKDAKWNITFTGDAIKILSRIDLNKSYALYSERPWSSPTGCTGIGQDVVVYAKQATDGATVIFAKPYFKGTVIFSGVRHYYASNSKDYYLYMEFIRKMIDNAYNNTLFTSK